MHKLLLLATAALILPMAACTSDISSSHYSTGSVGSVAQTMGGTVVSVRQISVSSEDNNAGTLIGGALGGIGGSIALFIISMFVSMGLINKKEY